MLSSGAGIHSCPDPVLGDRFVKLNNSGLNNDALTVEDGAE